ncbi:hypothetical protein LCGC14_2505910, partial [marine sediment metagenome]
MSKEFDPIQVSGYEEAEKDLTPKPVDDGEYDEQCDVPASTTTSLLIDTS